MKLFNKSIPQGDILVQLIDALPATATARPKGDEFVVAHSESGHHHVARPASRATTVELFEDSADPLRAYLRVRRVEREAALESASTLSASLGAMIDAAEARAATLDTIGDGLVLDHRKSGPDAHESIGYALPEGQDEAVFRISRQRQMTPAGWVRVAD